MVSGLSLFLVGCSLCVCHGGELTSSLGDPAISRSSVFHYDELTFRKEVASPLVRIAAVTKPPIIERESYRKEKIRTLVTTGPEARPRLFHVSDKRFPCGDWSAEKIANLEDTPEVGTAKMMSWLNNPAVLRRNGTRSLALSDYTKWPLHHEVVKSYFANETHKRSHHLMTPSNPITLAQLARKVLQSSDPDFPSTAAWGAQMALSRFHLNGTAESNYYWPRELVEDLYNNVTGADNILRSDSETSGGNQSSASESLSFYDLRIPEPPAWFQKQRPSRVWPPPFWNVWLQSAGSITTPHYDNELIMAVQCFGRKRWLFWPPEQLPLLRFQSDVHTGHHQTRMQTIGCRYAAQFNDSDDGNVYEYADCDHGYNLTQPYVIVETGPGDVLFSPPWWVHAVETVDPGVMVTVVNQAWSSPKVHPHFGLASDRLVARFAQESTRMGVYGLVKVFFKSLFERKVMKVVLGSNFSSLRDFSRALYESRHGSLKPSRSLNNRGMDAHARAATTRVGDPSVLLQDAAAFHHGPCIGPFGLRKVDETFSKDDVENSEDGGSDDHEKSSSGVFDLVIAASDYETFSHIHEEYERVFGLEEDGKSITPAVATEWLMTEMEITLSMMKIPEIYEKFVDSYISNPEVLVVREVLRCWSLF